MEACRGSADVMFAPMLVLGLTVTVRTNFSMFTAAPCTIPSYW